MEKDEFDYLDDLTKDNIAFSLWMKEFQEDKIPAEIKKCLLSDKNSAEAFGERMRFRIQNLLDNPDSFTPSYKKRYEKLLNHCASLTSMQAYALNHLLGMDSSRGYQKIPQESNIEFPRDFTPQLGYQVGWHFFVGNCRDSQKQEYGILVSFYRYSLLPPDIAHSFNLSDLENQIFEMQFAVAKAGEDHWQSRPFAIAGTTGLLKFSEHPFHYEAGKNRIISEKEDSLFPLRVQAWGVNQNNNNSEVEMEVDLKLSSNKDFLLQGKNGCLPCCCDIGTLYYSATNLSLGEGSLLRLNGEEINLVDGKFWFDHQWGNALEPLGNSRCEVVRAASVLSKPSHSRGWDWFMAQFNDNTEMTMYAPHTDKNLDFYWLTGEESPGKMTVDVRGQLISAENTVTDIEGTLNIDKWIKSVKSSYPEHYFITNTWYPDRWEFNFDEMVPEKIRNFTMTPIVKTGQTGYNASGAQYSEGGVYIKNKNDELIGKGFAESVYYANAHPNIFHLAGMGNVHEMQELMETPEASSWLKIRGLLYMAWPPHQKKLKKVLEKCLEQGLPNDFIAEK
ncbi:carotenoid 1,2-hydratase [Methanobacterium alcaliphilum]|uniref:carotenoid 1,2-hydratase n=1 Tax=Methanobacterium alcaliphilum TaxID=392018 RepID=UPI00200B6CBF|nr:carotenoid 1,2-hydratase [Methanobacterium alcaliphilum]MCK9151037.1 carotenoid 1,2-hydratase [Methanobacterium alcaliphilum]